MLEFIVTGHVPGTQIIITFQVFLAVASLIFGMSLARRIVRQNRQQDVMSIEDTTIQ